MMNINLDKRRERMHGKYESKSLEFRKHLTNLIKYAQTDITNYPLAESISFLQGYIDGLVQHEMEDYDSWLKDQQENADMTPNHAGFVNGVRVTR